MPDIFCTKSFFLSQNIWHRTVVTPILDGFQRIVTNLWFPIMPIVESISNRTVCTPYTCAQFLLFNAIPPDNFLFYLDQNLRHIAQWVPPVTLQLYWGPGYIVWVDANPSR